MKSIKLILFISALTFASCKTEKAVITNSKEDKINVELKKELEGTLKMDQGIREIVNGNLSGKRRAELLEKMNLDEKDIEGNEVFSIMKEIDSTNLIKVERIIKVHGYPGKALVGEPANKSVFYVIQHSDKIDQYLPLIRKAAEKGEIAKTSLAMMKEIEDFISDDMTRVENKKATNYGIVANQVLFPMGNDIANISVY